MIINLKNTGGKMQDRFKFRVWDKKRKEIRQTWSITPFGVVVNDVKTESYRIPLEDCIIMQCTGFKDKNCKLIFEGDIITVKYLGAQIPLFGRQYSNLPEDERFAIIYNYDWHKFCCENPNYKKTCEIHSLDLDAIQINTENKQYEVIGNIYENPELLEEEQC